MPGGGRDDDLDPGRDRRLPDRRRRHHLRLAAPARRGRRDDPHRHRPVADQLHALPRPVGAAQATAPTSRSRPRSSSASSRRSTTCAGSRPRTSSSAGRKVRAGDQLVLMYGSANRDPAHFDDPEALDLTRYPNRHLAFGFGTHFCLGASLARLEIRLFLEELVRRVRALRLVPDSSRRCRTRSCTACAPPTWSSTSSTDEQRTRGRWTRTSSRAPRHRSRGRRARLPRPEDRLLRVHRGRAPREGRVLRQRLPPLSLLLTIPGAATPAPARGG